jgi:hypothetical protein
MSQFYAKADDEERCVQSSIRRQPVMVMGLTTKGEPPSVALFNQLRMVTRNIPAIRCGSR